MADDKTDWDIDRAFRYVAKLRGPQEALPELATALHSGRLTIIMTTRDGYDGRVTWRGELGADWFRGPRGRGAGDHDPRLGRIRRQHVHRPGVACPATMAKVFDCPSGTRVLGVARTAREGSPGSGTEAEIGVVGGGQTALAAPL
jgi:hypothetical protein